MSLDVLALEFTDMQLKYSKEISAFLDRASAFGQDRILIYLYKEADMVANHRALMEQLGETDGEQLLKLSEKVLRFRKTMVCK